jgi:hypothetical protein
LTLVACFNFHHIMGFKIRCKWQARQNIHPNLSC